MELIFRCARRCQCIGFKPIEIGDRIIVQPRILVNDLVIPEVGIVGVGAQEVVLIESRPCDIWIRISRCRVDASSRRLAPGIEGDEIQKNARLPVAAVIVATASTAEATITTTAGGERNEDNE